MGDERRPEKAQRAPMVNLGLLIVWGMALGTVVFAITGQALWVAICPSFGVLVGALWQISQRSRDARG